MLSCDVYSKLVLNLYLVLLFDCETGIQKWLFIFLSIYSAFLLAIGHIVENTALLGDVVLRLPDIAHKVRYICMYTSI